MRRALLALLALTALVGCDPPSQADPARYGEVSVYVAPEWLSLDKARIRDELQLLGALGPRFVEAGEGHRSTARVIVQPFDSEGCTLGAGRWLVGSRVVEIDPTCTPGDTAFRQAVGHEIGHALGMSHICARPGDAPDCSTVGYGPAMMAPRLGGGGVSIGFGEAFADALGEDAPTVLDLAEYRRAHPDAGAP
ncbi:MAG: hypothetical protein EPO40_19455 [Myxococcaceae bacterium]|nr:MAG: hypothetical protein EPO40_19455 [Myxococcaceae bacterium]